METILYLAKLILALIFGVIFGKRAPKKVLNKSEIFLTITLYILLFFMGVNTGAIDNILLQLNFIGVKALFVTLFSLGGIILISLGASYLFDFKKKNLIKAGDLIIENNVVITSNDVNKLLKTKLSDESKIQVKKHWFKKIIFIIKEPIILVSTVILGIIFKLYTPLFDWYRSSLISYLLYVLLFFSGLGLVKAKLNIKEIFASPIL